jgi:hypothetical protein
LESIAKNCGGPVQKEVAQRDVVDALRELAKVRDFATKKTINKFLHFEEWTGSNPR